jgi:hypothetical protein
MAMEVVSSTDLREDGEGSFVGAVLCVSNFAGIASNSSAIHTFMA